MQAVFMKVVTNRIKKKRYLIDVQFSSDKKLATTHDRQTPKILVKSNIVSIGSSVWLFLLDFAQTEFVF